MHTDQIFKSISDNATHAIESTSVIVASLFDFVLLPLKPAGGSGGKLPDNAVPSLRCGRKIVRWIVFLVREHRQLFLSVILCTLHLIVTDRCDIRNDAKFNCLDCLC